MANESEWLRAIHAERVWRAAAEAERDALALVVRQKLPTYRGQTTFSRMEPFMFDEIEQKTYTATAEAKAKPTKNPKMRVVRASVLKATAEQIMANLEQCPVGTVHLAIANTKAKLDDIIAAMEHTD